MLGHDGIELLQKGGRLRGERHEGLRHSTLQFLRLLGLDLSLMPMAR